MIAEPEPLGVEARAFGWTYRDRPAPALRGITFNLAPGQVMLVLGPSGSGKSTLARALAGIVPHALAGGWEGSLDVGGLDVPATSAAVLGERVGMVFQDPDSQIVMPTVEDEVAFGLENRGWPLPSMRGTVPRALADVGLAGFEARSTGRLSGGERQRLALAEVLAPAPGLLGLVEPTANLDPPGMHSVFERLGQLAAQRRRTLVVVEHRLEAALPMADVVLLLDADGSQVWFGPATEVGPAEARRLWAAGGWVPVAWERRWGTAADVAGAVASRSAPVKAPGQAVVDAVRLTVRLPAERSGTERLALDRVALEVAAGERLAVVGPNGSGKSTLLFVLAGLRRPDAGRVRLGDGSAPPSLDPARLSSADLPSHVALLFQDPELGFVARSVLGEVLAGRPAIPGAPDRRAGDGPHRSALPPAPPAALDALERFGLGHLAAQDPFRISQGEQRRLGLAAIALRPPALLLLDEPTFGLDRLGAERVVALLEAARQAGQAQVIATHDPRLLPACDRVLALDGGRVVFSGPTSAFLADPPYRPATPWRPADEWPG